MNRSKYISGAIFLSSALLSFAVYANTEFKVICGDEGALETMIKNYHPDKVSAPAVSGDKICVTIEGDPLVYSPDKKAKEKK